MQVQLARVKRLLSKVKTIYKEKGILTLGKKIGTFLKSLFSLNSISSNSYPLNYNDLEKLSSRELLGIISHEAHRIEKANYNNILKEKSNTYENKKKRVERALDILDNRNHSTDTEVKKWSKAIINSFNNLQEEFLEEKTTEPPDINSSRMESFIDYLKSRRSVRVWDGQQPDKKTLNQLGKRLVEAAKWSPNSGNRQAWKFRIIVDKSEKKLLEPIKETHTVSAPLIIFVGIDERLYGDVANGEKTMYLDAGAVTMQMILAAHKGGYGTCWNHFGTDLIDSRSSNKEAYSEFTDELNIPQYIKPMVLLSVGKAKFMPPPPGRVDIRTLMLE